MRVVIVAQKPLGRATLSVAPWRRRRADPLRALQMRAREKKNGAFVHDSLIKFKGEL